MTKSLGVHKISEPFLRRFWTELSYSFRSISI